MKKSLIIISAFLLVFATALTACGNKNIIVDKDGHSYVPVTDKDGNKRKATELLVSSAAFTGEKREAAAKPTPTEDDYSAISDDDLPF